MESFDVKAVIEYVKRRYTNLPVGVIGVSMGGAASLLASPLGVDALVIESVYPDIESAVHNRVRNRLGWLSWLPSKLLLIQLEPRLGVDLNDLRPIDKLKDVDSPILIISGINDRHTTKDETMAMYERARPPKTIWLVDNVQHQDIHSAYPNEYEDRVERFLDTHLGSH